MQFALKINYWFIHFPVVIIIFRYLIILFNRKIDLLVNLFQKYFSFEFFFHFLMLQSTLIAYYYPIHFNLFMIIFQFLIIQFPFIIFKLFILYCLIILIFLFLIIKLTNSFIFLFQ